MSYRVTFTGELPLGASTVRTIRDAAGLDLTAGVAAYRAGWVDVPNLVTAQRVLDGLRSLGADGKIAATGEAERARLAWVDFARENLRLQLDSGDHGTTVALQVRRHAEKIPGVNAWETISEVSRGD